MLAAHPGAPRAQPATATLVVVVLLHETLWPNWPIWVAWEALHAGAVGVYCHVKAGVRLPRNAEGAAIRDRLLVVRRRSEWGDVSLTEAMLDAGAEAIALQPCATHVAFASGTCVPVARASGRTLPRAGASFFQPFGFGASTLTMARCELRAALEAEVAGRSAPVAFSTADAAAWAAGLELYHQWCILAAPMVLALQSCRDEIAFVGGVMGAAFMGHRAIELAPDEALLLTAARRFSLTRRGLQLTVRMSTLVHYKAGDNDTRHPVTWRSLDAGDVAEVGVRPRRGVKAAKLSLPTALTDAALPANSSLFMRKVHLQPPAVDDLLRLLQASHWAE